tara:strand:+ start:1284 stop:1964 length:681 start_codon:yes stop_codon:yes gene_type:complete
MKFIIYHIYGYFVYLSKIFSRKNLNKYIAQQLINVKPGSKVLLVGAGGRIDTLISKLSVENDFHLRTIDINPDYEPDISADICDYDFSGEKYDVVLIPEVLQAIKTPIKAIENIYSALNKGGKIILTVPFIFPLVDRPQDFYRFTKYGIFYLLSDFNNVEVIERNSWTETISVLFVRHIMNQNLSSKLFALIFILTSILFYPFIYILGKLVNTDYICSGYSSSGIK